MPVRLPCSDGLVNRVNLAKIGMQEQSDNVRWHTAHILNPAEN